MRYKLSHLVVMGLFVAMLSSWLTATVMSQSVMDKARNRSVRVLSGASSCSGVILQTNLVMTAAHCVGSKNISVDGKEANVFKKDDVTDLALLRVETIVIDRILVADLMAGDDVFTFGYPMESPNIVFSKGYVAVIQFKQSYTSNLAMPGSSGSPLFNQSGQLVGIITGSAMRQNAYSVNVLPYDIRAFWEVK